MTEAAPKLTPMMERYLEVKAQNPGTILLFRMGDFYELFFEDAQNAARILGLTLTSRDKGSANPVPMAGFPYHALDGYLQKLVKAGLRAAICEQVEDPKQAKGLVKREVTRVVTPGTVTDDSLLDPRASNFLAGVFFGKQAVGLAWLELSTGRFVAAELEPSQLEDELARLAPSEILIAESAARGNPLSREWKLRGLCLTERPDWCFAHDATRKHLLQHFGTSTLDGFDLDSDSLGVTAAGALLEYVLETQKSAVGHIVLIEPYRRGANLLIDEATRRSLELTQTIREGRREGSLLDILDETVTPMGARLLAERLSNPITDRATLEQRLDTVEAFTRQSILGREIQTVLKEAYDLQRLTARIATGRASPRDLGSLAKTLALIPSLKAKLAGSKSPGIAALESRLDLCAEIRADIEKSLVDEPPLLVTEGNIFRGGFHPDLDELRGLARGGKEWIARYLADEIERTGISNLKIGFNRVFGYYLEVTGSQMSKVPGHYIRKQTLKNQERYITPPLKEHEDKVLRAEERSIALEKELFNALRDRVARECTRLQATAEVLAEIDVHVALALLAVSRRYCRPVLCDEPILDIREGRHPVLDKLQPTGQFVPNDVRLGCGVDPASGDGSGGSGRLQIITGPNMAGKSTYIRQAALLVVMAQLGSFVPATSARIGLADRIFARVGASDELGKGQSTFMVEMTETARILNAATPKSLVILDEIGRGTSTYDGVSLAWAVTEYLHDALGSRTMFATHYHELTDLTQTLKHASNWNVAVREEAGNVVFLHRIVPGAADKSYGIHVARLAGLPQQVLDRARTILTSLENEHVDEAGRTKIPARKKRRSNIRQLVLFEPEPLTSESEAQAVVEDLRRLNINQLTPTAALHELHRLQKEAQPTEPETRISEPKTK